MTSHLYVPIVKGKANDIKAAGRTSSTAKGLLKPLIEIVPGDSDVTVDDHIEKFAHHLAKFMGGTPMYVDFYGLQPESVLETGVDATIGGLRLLKSKGLTVTPTYGFDRDDNLWLPLRSEVRRFGQGFCFRIDIDDLDERAEETWEQVLERSAELGLAPTEIDLLIDLRYVGDERAEYFKNLVIDFLSLMPKGRKYRSIVVSGSSALKHVGSVPKDGVAEIERKELRVWLELQLDLLGLHNLVFSDYGVVHPDFSLVGPNKNANAKIRYTTSGRIRVFRGHRLLDAPGYKQYHALSELVRNTPDFRGRHFSHGDRYVDDCADGNVSSGNLGTWVFVDMNHHLQQTAVQMRDLIPRIDATFQADNVEEVMEAV